MNLIEKVSSSKPFIAALCAAALVSVIFGLQAYFIIMCAVFVIIIMLAPSGQSTAAFPAVAAIVTSLTCYGRSADFFPLFVMVVPLACSLLFNIIFYKKRIKLKTLKTPAFIGLLLTAAAVTLGGLGINPPSDYLGWGAYYYIGLGVGLVVSYIIIRLLAAGEDAERALKRILDSLILGGILAALVIILYYVICVREFLHTFSSISFLSINPVRNLSAIFLVPASGLSVLRIKEKKSYIAATSLILLASLMSSSRTALLFSTATAVLAAAYVIISRTEKKRAAIIAFAVIGVCSVAAAAVLYKLTTSRTDASQMFRSIIRITLCKCGIKDFLESPILGKGIIYSGNARHFRTDLFMYEIQWYHNAVIQVLGSFGLLGVLTYGYQLYARVKTALESKSKYAFEALSVYVGILLLSMTEPGIFCPVPTALIPVIMFALIDMQALSDGKRDLKKKDKNRR